MRVLKGHCKTLYSTLKRGGNWTVSELCRELDFPTKNQPTDLYYAERVRTLIAQLREKFRQNEMNPQNPWLFLDDNKAEEILWVGSDFNGYTLQSTIHARAFESRVRTAQSTSIMLNGIPVFSDFKRLAPKAFLKLQIEVKPKLLQVNRLLKK